MNPAENCNADDYLLVSIALPVVMGHLFGDSFTTVPLSIEAYRNLIKNTPNISGQDGHALPSCLFHYNELIGVPMLTLYLSFLDDESDCHLFEEIYNTYRKQMFSIARSILKNNMDAEDAVHSVFLSIAAKHLPTVKKISDPADLRNYLLKATKNTALNSLKKQMKTAISLDTLVCSEADPHGNFSDDVFIDSICNHFEYEHVVASIKALNEIYRDVLYYHFVLELSIPDVAKLLDRNVTTVKRQLVRGKKLLLNLLDTNGGNNNAAD